MRLDYFSHHNITYLLIIVQLLEQRETLLVSYITSNALLEELLNLQLAYERAARTFSTNKQASANYPSMHTRLGILAVTFYAI